jgi:hypothetical protein
VGNLRAAVATAPNTVELWELLLELLGSEPDAGRSCCACWRSYTVTAWCLMHLIFDAVLPTNGQRRERQALMGQSHAFAE